MRIWSKAEPGGSWASRPIAAAGVALWRTVTGPIVICDLGENGAAPAGAVASDGGGRDDAVVGLIARLIPFAASGRTEIALISVPAAVTVNGCVSPPVTVLAHADEIAAGGERLVFTAYGAADVVPYPGSVADARRCGRCRTLLRPGDEVVGCPACGAWHHEGLLAPHAGMTSPSRRACYSYDPQCGACRARRAALAWTPNADEEDGEPAC